MPEGIPSFTVEIGPDQQQWLAGIAAGSDVTEAHADTPFPDHDTRVQLWWFYVGVLAGQQAAEHGWDKLDMFLLGASLRAPAKPEDDGG